MHAKEHASMSNENSNPANLFPQRETPNPFSPDWHHQFGAKLSVFPRYVSLFDHADKELKFWPDLATFVEGREWNALMYYAGSRSDSICIVHWTDGPRWEVIQFNDERIVGKSVSPSYKELVRRI
jgi:hypothetical protein